MCYNQCANMSDQLMQQLYLLEVMVDQISLTPGVSPGCPCESDNPGAKGDLSVRVKFFDFPCLDIQQAEFGRHERRGDFSSGKSLLFPMDPLDMVRALQYYPLAVSVLQPRPKASLPRVLGVCTVTLPESMVDAVRRARRCCANQQEAVLKDDFQLVTLSGQSSGSVRLFVRLSCLGQSLVTDFAADADAPLALSGHDSSGACPSCLSRADPSDARAADVRLAEGLLSCHERCCPGREPCTCPEAAPVAWRPRASCQCAPPTPRSFLSLIVGKMAVEAEAAWAAQVLPKEEARPDAGDAAPQPAAAPEPPVPAVRYDTTGALSPAAAGGGEGGLVAPPPAPPLPHPAVRYDTTGCLSAATATTCPRGLLQPTPPVRYDNTGALSAAARCPPVRYDTTGALSKASQGGVVKA